MTATAAAWLLLAWQDMLHPALAAVTGLVLVAGIGWADDHRPLSVRLRLVVHFSASALATSSWFLPMSEPQAWIALTAAVMLLAGCVNAWNFMDGIDGLVATQSLWCAAILALAFGAAGQDGWAMAAAALAAACLGFIPFNLPRARIFLGDVGSGGLGFACAALGLAAWKTATIDPWALLLLPSALLVDAGMTLASRVVAGRRWYSAHREHLYQWLVRSGRRHVSVTALYLLWNLIVVLPALLLSRSAPTLAPLACVATYAAGATLWWVAKQRVLVSRRATAARSR